jgi:hypothetical protein
MFSKDYRMFFEKKTLAAVLMLMGLISVAGNRELFSQQGNPESGDPWVITYPGDGMVLNSAPHYIGTGPSESIAALYVFDRLDFIPGGVYASELNLRRMSYLDTQSSTAWTEVPYNAGAGSFFVAVLPSAYGQAPDMPFVPDPMGPGEDVNNIALVMGGDGASYDVQEEMPAL